MLQKLHKNAKTNYAIREAIKQNQEPIAVLARKYNLTDNCFEFSYKALPPNKKTKKIHPFDQICQKEKIQHQTIKFKHPWTNGMVERFNGKIKTKIFRRFLFADEEDFKTKLNYYLKHYNFEVKLR